MTSIRPRDVVVVLIAAIALSGCSPDKPANNNGNGTSETATTGNQAPKLPNRLPTINGAESVEKVQRDLINLAAGTAVGAPEKDRHPKVVVTSDFACGVKVKAIACPDSTDPTGSEVTVYLNPTTTWEQYQQPIGHGGGDVVVQNTTLAAYVQYLMYRDLQRNHPEALTGSDDAALLVGVQTVMCKNGEVYGGLHYIMNGELAQMWQANTANKQGEYFTKGTKGQC